MKRGDVKILCPEVKPGAALSDLPGTCLSMPSGSDPKSVCYVSGPISSRSGQSAAQNIDMLQTYASEMDSRGTCSHVIDPSAVRDLEARGWSRDEVIQLWDQPAQVR